MPKQNNYHNSEQDRRISLIEEHIAVYNKEMGETRRDIGIIKTDVCWLKKFFWVVVVASVSGLMTGIINLLQK